MKNNKVFQVGITGGIGSGKSTICKVFASLGVPVYDADTEAKWVMENDSELMAAIKKQFGEEAYLPDGGLNRLHLRQLAFVDLQSTEKLNAIVHPAVGRHYANWVKVNETATYLVKEAALLFESESHKALHFVINISCEESIRIKRTLARDPNRTEEQVRNLIARQYTDEKRASLADFSLNNSGDLPLLQSLLTLHQQFSHLDFQLQYGIHRQAID